MPHSKKTTVQQTNNRNNTESKAKASAKSKELQPQPQADTVAAHLLLPNRTATFNIQLTFSNEATV